MQNHSREDALLHQSASAGDRIKEFNAGNVLANDYSNQMEVVNLIEMKLCQILWRKSATLEIVSFCGVDWLSERILWNVLCTIFEDKIDAAAQKGFKIFLSQGLFGSNIIQNTKHVFHLV